MSDQEEKEDCQVCKKLFISKNPNMMTDGAHAAMKCMASDVDSSDSCSEKGHGLRAADKIMKEKPVPKARLSVKPKSIIELSNYDGDSSDSCSEKGLIMDNVKVRDHALSRNLAAKPPKVKSVKSSLDTVSHLDAKQSNSKQLTRERNAKSSRKINLIPTDSDNIEKEIQTKIASRSHLQNIIDEAMDHFQKLTSKSVPGNAKQTSEKPKETEESNLKRDKTDRQINMLESPGELERVVSPDRPSSREDTVSPFRKHLNIPGNNNSSSPSGSVSGSRRKLPQPPGQNKLTCSVTSLVHSSLDSDSSRPNSSADFSDVSDCSSVSKGDNTVTNASVTKSLPVVSDAISKLLVQDSGKGEFQEPVQAVDIILTSNTKDGENTNTNSCRNSEKIKTEPYGCEIVITEVDCDNVKDTTFSIKEHSNHKKHSKNSSREYGNSLCSTELDESVGPLNETDISISESDSRTNNSSEFNANSSDETVQNLNNSYQSNSDKDSAINRRTSECGKENELIPTNHRHISRSPSYRKKVMAKARSKYHRQLKAIKCKSGECSDNCGICGSSNTESILRSHTSIGVPTENFSEEQYLEQSSPRRAYTPDPPPLPLAKSPGSGQRSLKKVPISPRVDLLMTNNLFKKHLTKHEDLLQKHTLSYRKFGLQKAVSNLDLSEGYLFDEVGDDVFMDNDRHEQMVLKSSVDLTSSKPKHTSRRYSLTGENNFSVSEINKELENEVEQESKGPKSHARTPSLDENRFNSKTRQFQVPSFAEFRRSRSQKRRILPSNTLVSCSDSTSSQTKTNLNQNDSAILSNSKGSLDNETMTISEVSELTLSKGQLHTIDESVVNNQHDHGQNLENKNISISENEKPEITDNKCSEDLDKNEIGSIEHNKRMQADTSAAGVDSSLESTGKFEHLFVNVSLSAEDKSPLSTSEMDGKEIPLRGINWETDSVGSQDLSYSDFSSSEISNTAASKSATKEKHRKGAKRPRSLISKKASLISLIKESEHKDNAASCKASRPTMKRGGSLNNLMKSDENTLSDAHGADRADSFRSVKSEGHSATSDTSIDIKDTSRTGRADSFRSTKSEGHHTKYTSSVKIESLRKKTNHASVAAEGDDSVSFTLGVNGQSKVSYEVRKPDQEAASLSGSVASESLASEVSGLPEEDGDVLGQTFEFEVQDDIDERLKTSKDDTLAPVLRSTSDACDATPEALKKRRERKERPYKSDPFSGTEIIPASKRYSIKEDKARLGQLRSLTSSSREEVLDFLDVVSHQTQLPPADSFPSLEELNEDDEQNLSASDVTTDSTKKIRNVVSTASTASTDSGVIGQEESHDSQQSSPSNTLTLPHRLLSWPEFQHQEGSQPHISASCSDLSRAEMDSCLDCVHMKKLDVQNVLQICSRCYQKRVERKKTFQEIIDTEVNYGRDLNILKEEFYEPMKKTCLLNKDQLDSIFLNLDELIHVNTYFLGKLRAAVNTANHNNDEDLQDVRIGSLFLESSSMFLTFENYCVNQAQAPVLLEQLEREKELLRIFLHVSQSDNHLLRRMHLKSFLMVPVQRIMKYPMLLDRLYKATPSKNEDKESIREAKEKIEDILGHINAKSKVSMSGSIKMSQKRKLSERHCSVTEKVEVLRVALESLGWSRKDVCDVITSRLHLTVPVDHLWASKKCKNLKFTPALGVLLTLGEPSFEQCDKNLVFPNNSSVRSAAVVLIREKNGKYQVLRDPLMLEKCVVSQDPDFTEVFEVLEWNKESLLIKADSQNETNQWVCYLRQQMQQLGCWRKRRNALPNILLNHLSQ